MDPNRRGIIKKGGYPPVFTIRKLRAEFDGRTQAVRGALIAELEELHQWALERAKAVRDEKLKIKWSNAITYIAKTITYISSEYDSNKILERLEALEAKVGELREKDRGSGKRGRKAGRKKSSS